MKTLLQGFYHLLFPDCCAQCKGQLYSFENTICSACIEGLPRTGFDFQPGNPVEKIFWGRVPIVSASAFLAFSKQGQVQDLMFQIKYKAHTELAMFLGNLYGQHILKHLSSGSFDMIIPIPLHKKKLRQRGYNQCEYIGRGLAEALEIPIEIDVLHRNIHNPSQTKRNREDRWKNVESIFSIDNPKKISGKHLLLIDDVVTTGATLEAACIPLLAVSGVRISIVTLAFPE